MRSALGEIAGAPRAVSPVGKFLNENFLRIGIYAIVLARVEMQEQWDGGLCGVSRGSLQRSAGVQILDNAGSSKFSSHNPLINLKMANGIFGKI